MTAVIITNWHEGLPYFRSITLKSTHLRQKFSVDVLKEKYFLSQIILAVYDPKSKFDSKLNVSKIFLYFVYMLKNAEVLKQRELCIVFYLRFLMKIVQIPRSWDLTRDFWAAYHMPLIYTFLNLNTKSITTSFLQPNLIFEIFNYFFQRGIQRIGRSTKKRKDTTVSIIFSYFFIFMTLKNSLSL